MDRLTKLYKAGRYGLVKVKDNEQEVDSPYPNTLKAILECFQQLGAYEDTELLPAEITAMKDENARLRAELEAAKSDIRRMLQADEMEGMCVYCKQITNPMCACCADADWRGLCAENGGKENG